MNKNLNKIIVMFIIIISLVLLVKSTSKAISISGIMSSADEFVQSGEKAGSAISQDSLKETFFPIAQILVRIGTFVIVIVTTIMGIKYIVSSPDDKAKLKTQLIGLAVATVIIAGAQIIWATIYGFLNSTF